MDDFSNNKQYNVIHPKKLPTTYFSAPSKVYFELTRNCNLQCKHCYNESGTALDNELTKFEIFKLLSDLKNAGTFEARFTGGEPTQRSDFFEIVNYAHSLGFFISIGTNGVWSDRLLKKISLSPINMVIISLEGNKTTNDSIRGRGSFDSAVKSLNYLAKHSNKQLRINMTMGKHNVHEINFIIDLADRINVPVINTMPIRLSGRSKSAINNILTPQDYYDFVKQIELLRKSHRVKIQSYFDILGKKSRWLENQTSLVNKRTCAAGVEACVVSPLGDVYGCAASNPKENNLPMFIAGNVRKKPIMNIWHDNDRWQLYRDFKQNKSKHCLKCSHYMKKCFGNCFVSSFFDSGKLNSPDPYCFTHLLEVKEND